jgi:hypothetical protein
MFPRKRPPLAELAVRLALAGGYLSAVADRFGLWGLPGTPGVAWGGFGPFLAYTGILLWFLPSSLVMAAGWMATATELLLAFGLLTGVQIRAVALASGLLLTTFGVTMTIAIGPEPAFSYSVWTAAAASLLLRCFVISHRCNQN